MQSWDHSAVTFSGSWYRALIFSRKRIQPFLSHYPDKIQFSLPDFLGVIARCKSFAFHKGERQTFYDHVCHLYNYSLKKIKKKNPCSKSTVLKYLNKKTNTQNLNILYFLLIFVLCHKNSRVTKHSLSVRGCVQDYISFSF